MKKGFSLIELLVITSITLLFSGIILVQYNNYTQEQKLKNEARKLIDIMELAKKKAVTSDLIPTPNVTPPTFCTNFTGYQLSLNTNSSYSLNYCCDSICSTVVNSYTFNSKILLTAPVSIPANLIFTPLMKKFLLTINSITLKNTVVNKCVTISVSPIGVIELDESLLGC
ncbi:MAG: hypothetical protein WC741_04970 [Patescibacteria group bacterium]|jgi:Tfp pilus assembly protein PilE